VKRTILTAVAVLLLATLATPLRPPAPFAARTQLPHIAKDEYYEVLTSGYALLRKLKSETITLVDLRTGQAMWHLVPDVGSLSDLGIQDGVFIVTGHEWSDRTHVAVTPDGFTEGLDLRTGRFLWRQAGVYLGHGVGRIAPVYGLDNGRTAAGLDVHTGAQVWQSPWLQPSNMFDDGRQWDIAADGTVRAIDLATGAAEVRGSAAPSTFIIGWSASRLLVEPLVDLSGGESVATLYDRATLQPIQHFTNHQPNMFPATLWLCGSAVCDRDGVALTAYDAITGQERFTRDQFDLNDVIAQSDGRTLAFGMQSRSGVVVPGVPMDTDQFLDLGTGTALMDIGVWRELRVVGNRMWVGSFASGNPAEVIFGGTQATSQAVLGEIDLTPGSPLTVHTVANLGGPFENCDLNDGWMVCTSEYNEYAPIAFELPA
jgi:hypothetical protein